MVTSARIIPVATETLKLLKFLLNLEYEFYDANTYEKITDINDYSSKIQTGSSVNIFLM